MDQAQQIAAARESGVVKNAALVREHGRPIYSFEIERGGRVLEIAVDANTGAVIRDKTKNTTAGGHTKRRTER